MLSPSRVRRRILDEHTRISGWLGELEHLARRLRRGEEELGPVLGRRIREFGSFFASHLALEERVLAPALRRSGERGAELAERLVAEHASQREQLEDFVHTLAGSAPDPELADRVDDFVARLRLDMLGEEAFELDPALLVDPEA